MTTCAVQPRSGVEGSGGGGGSGKTGAGGAPVPFVTLSPFLLFLSQKRFFHFTMVTEVPLPILLTRTTTIAY